MPPGSIELTNLTVSPPALDTAAVAESAQGSSGARIVRNVSALGVGQIFTWLTTMGLVALLPRYLGDANLGKLAAAISLTDLCGLIAGLGITTYLTKEIARKGTEGRADILNALVTRAPLAFVAAVGAAVAALALGYDPLTQQVVLLLCLNLVLTALSGVLLGALQGMQDMRPVALVGALSKALYLGLVALALVNGGGLVGVAIATDIAAVVTVIGYAIPLARRGALRGPVDVTTWRRLIVGSLPFFVWQAALMVYGQVDIILLHQLTRDAVVGWYVAAYRIIGIPVFVPVIVAAAVFPTLAQSAGRVGPHFANLARSSMQVVLLLTIPMALGTIVIAERLMDFLQYPVEFRNSIPLIVILSMHIPLVGADMVIGNVLNARDRQRRWAAAGVGAALLNPALNVLLIPLTDRVYQNGAIGAALATVLTEIFMMVVGLVLLKGTIFNLSTLQFGVKCLLAGAVMSGVVWLARDAPLPLTVMLGAVVYGLVALALRVVSVRDLGVVRTYVSQRLAAKSASAS